jgi:hypothetical protein
MHNLFGYLQRLTRRRRKMLGMATAIKDEATVNTARERLAATH